MATKCAFCREEITGAPIKRGKKIYCCDACAFEDSLKINSMCGSRGSLETAMRYQRGTSQGQ